MAARLDCAVGVAGENHRQVVMGMSVAVADGAPIDYHAVIEQCAVTFLDTFKAIEEVREQRAMIAVDFREILNLVFGVPVMTDAVVALPYTEVRIAAVVTIMGQQIGSDPGAVGLECQRHHVAH